MDPDERKWLEEMVAQCEAATRKGVTVLMIRKQDQEGGADIVVTNATNPDLVAAMNGNYEPDDEDE